MNIFCKGVIQPFLQYLFAPILIFCPSARGIYKKYFSSVSGYDISYLQDGITASIAILNAVLFIPRRSDFRMNIKKAVEMRIIELCVQRNIAINSLANISGMPPSTIYSMLNGKSSNPGIVSIKKICDGLDIGIREFFDSPLFDSLEQEIK